MSANAEKKDYIRVKRRNQTFFIHASPSDTFFHIKSEISKAINCCTSSDNDDDDISPRKMRLYLPPSSKSKKNGKIGQGDGDDDDDNGDASSPRGPIPDSAMLSDHDVKNDDVLYVTFVKNLGGDVPEDGDEDAWEKIEVDT
mmetsp:Transcript_17973/g.37690  ORF Transcript_17973/g.37690 Transcript_17973/m.37690 type:complete len:142 (+) Transcript_17973:121-546(+)|eukprot:CAMPEP_0171342004 /NCGR_PEP_ID=MMETSP0878-20121228/12845_1 /TAXON_ID=67004 /ORGANISM="Thalassiosira weissflogii, Strain CCMP1336" /LENGTH=141 /DNA_ID=CAMNT_0011844523 /DNA_START=65 /DNA_END=490 /DNA_ORIENTATION=-